MSGFAEVLTGLAPLIKAQWILTLPTATLADVRIMGNNDPIIGANGWVPRVDNQPFVILTGTGARSRRPETNRIWTMNHLEMFLAITQDTTGADQNYTYIALRWIDAAWDMVAANTRCGIVGASLSPTAGDVWWELHAAEIIPSRTVNGIEYYGVLCKSVVRIVRSVTYQG